MIRSNARPDLKRNKIDHKKTQFARPNYKENDYPHRLSLYDIPPTSEISLEQFETWAIDRLRSTTPITMSLPNTDRSSSRRTGIMLVPKQIPPRDSRASRTLAQEVPAFIEQLNSCRRPSRSEAKRRAQERSLLTLDFTACFLLDRRSETTICPCGNHAVQTKIQSRRWKREKGIH